MAKLRKEEAAKLLGVSLRTLESYQRQGKLNYEYQRGKTRDIVVFEETDVARLKAELEAPTYIPRAAETAPSAQNSAAKTDAAQELARLPEQAEMLRTLTEFFGQLRDSQQTKGLREMSILELAQMPLLKLKEAQRYANLSRGELRAAIATQKLPAAKTGRGWRIRREALDDYIRHNF